MERPMSFLVCQRKTDKRGPRNLLYSFVSSVQKDGKATVLDSIFLVATVDKNRFYGDILNSQYTDYWS